MQYRHEPIHSQLLRLGHKHSMLHVDVLMLIYHFARTCAGAILEIGAFVGGATLAAGLGVRASGQAKPIIAIEPGGRVRHDRLSTRNILRDLERNLTKHGMLKMITLFNSYSFAEATISAVHRTLGEEPVALLIIDADGAVQRDLNCYRDKLADNCWMVIDDYFGPDTNSKITSTRTEVDALVASNWLVPLGFYGWGTWIGQWRRLTPPPAR